MTFRSPSRDSYWLRMATVVMLLLVAYAVVTAMTGGGAFMFWRPDRMRLVLFALIVIGVTAYEFRPIAGLPKGEEQEDEEQEALHETVVVPDAPEVPVAVGGTSPDVREPGIGVPEPVGKEPLQELFETSFGAEVVPEAEETWNRARKMTHGFVPDKVKDARYLKLVRKAADFGHVLAMVKLGDYAFRRGWTVEAYYWTLLAQLKGAPDLDAALGEIRKVWTLQGDPPEYENVRPDFTEVQGMFARAALRLKCGRGAAYARKRLQELRESNCPEAALYLARAAARQA